jgi:hypothetical protein
MNKQSNQNYARMPVTRTIEACKTAVEVFGILKGLSKKEWVLVCALRRGYCCR